ncbi:Leucine zipper protein [Actinidia chinensis var. chinensis]|uniref:Leucine zipper protein n=1 Tax=Actinidia chinensis var. chinensis TaxID=1590841 RepID=A0A2R6RAV2_ACTCC|nr:Leucine zipper protein [Actinidia chinensis var. chinensis]
MAVSSSTWILSLKVVLISTGVVSIAVMMKFSVPLIMDFAIYKLPLIWSALVSWLRPPYLYFVINFIIIAIVATSRFHHRKSEAEPLVPSANPPPSDLHSPQPEFGDLVLPAAHESESVVSEVKNVEVSGDAEDDQDDAFVISRSTWPPPQRTISPEMDPVYQPTTPEKPLVSSRFGHRRPLKASPEGARVLRVAKPKRHETFDNTWRMITDGRHVPLTRHLKKSDTWEHHGRPFNTTSPLDQSPQMVKKSETFRDRTNFEPATSSPGSGKLRKEPSLSQDELNRRVEAFIKKFNDEMRLQRQESLNQYVEMINRGAH